MNSTSTAVPYQTFNVIPVGGHGPAATTSLVQSPADHAPGLRQQLLAHLPKASKVLFVGETAKELIADYRHIHRPDSCQQLAWDEVLPESAKLCQLIVLGSGMRSQDGASAMLRTLASASSSSAELFICETTGPHAIEPLFELLSNSGWMPNLLRSDESDRTSSGEPAAWMIQATKPFGPEVKTSRPARFSVIVASPSQSGQTPAAIDSPGLAEVQAHVSIGTDPGSAAQAISNAAALDKTKTDWLLLCHEDAYFPAGFGKRLNAMLAKIPKADQVASLIGFIGISVDVSNQGFAPAGFIIEQLRREDFPETVNAVSIDEIAVLISRKSVHRIDPEMGWQLWATDLCMSAICKHKVYPRVVRMPLLNRSSNVNERQAGNHESASRLLSKFPEFGPIPTLHGMIDANFVERQRALDQSEKAVLPSDAPVSVPAMTAQPARKETAAPVVSSAAGQSACSICGETVAAWVPHPQTSMRSEFMKLLDPVGSDLSVYQCPSCGSTDRDRHLWHYMKAIGLLQRLPSAQVLHIAPEAHLEALIQAIKPIAYVRGDLHPRRADHLPLNVQALPFDDGGFDLIICNHVLEHVASPAAALAEFHRCLAPGGLLIAQTPYAPVLLKTMELNRPVSAGFAKLFFGQEDHVRLFGADIVDYFNAAGFSGELLSHETVLGDMDAKAFGCNAREPFFAFSR